MSTRDRSSAPPPASRQRPTRFLTMCVAIAVASGGGAAAQTVRGQVIDSISGAPVDRGFIVIVDSTGREVQRVLTTTSGRFTVQLAQPGEYHLRSERIGFRVWESPLLRLEAGRTYEWNPLITALPRRLATINVSGETECEDRKGPDTGLLWEEARKALVAASWSAAQDLYVHRAHRYERVLDRGRNEVSETITVPVLSSQLPFVSEDPVTLATHGYILPDSSSDEWDWWAPDANVFLHESFHQSHCFWAVRGDDEQQGLVGLAFEPIPDREVSDIAGTLWLDEETAELRYLEFGFRNPPFNVSTRNSGGRAEFLQMPTGAWILDRWQMVIPQMQGSLRRVRIVGYVEAGGDVIEAYTPEGELVYENPNRVVVRGTVYDSTVMSQLPGDAVSVLGSEYTVQTNDVGFFELRTLLRGEYILTSRRMEWLGFTPGRKTVDLSPGDTVDVQLVIPSLETAHRQLCRRAPPESNRVVHGEVRTPEGVPLFGAEVVGEWAPGIRRTARTDGEGRYVLCDLPDNAPLTLTIDHRMFEAEPVVVQFIGPDLLVTAGEERSSFYAPDRVVRLGIEAKRIVR